jgi:hypothetical protein
MRRQSIAALIGFALLVWPFSGDAQKPKDEPPRPRLAVGADTNSARVYYDYGLTKIEREPDKAADAFYWAMRINPGFAEAYYARRCAMLLRDKTRLQRYIENDRHTLRSDEIERIDSLYYYALTISPFMYPGLDALLFRGYFDAVTDDYVRRTNASPSEVQFELNRRLLSAPASFKAWRAYSEGRFPDAVTFYATAIKDAKFTSDLRADRGRVFFQLGQADSALAELTRSLDELRKADKEDIVFVYESKALLEHSIGLVQQRLGNEVAAKEAFAHALEEDLSYFPAHLQLAYTALAQNDTATALSEMDLAVQIRGDDPVLRYIYGYALGTSGKFGDAEVQLRKAIAVDPVFATPYHILGQVLESEGKWSDAAAQYESFLMKASQADPRRKEAADRLRDLAVKDDR